MSSPSTPRTAQSASPTGSPMLTPGRKIKALLAAFDSDSESDNENSKQRQPIFKPQISARESESDDDEDIVMPKGRLAARMQTQNQTSTATSNESTSPKTAFDRVSKFLRAERVQSKENETDPEEIGSSEEDDLPTAGPRRTNKNQRMTADASDDDHTARSPSRARSFSPLFMSSPMKQTHVDDESEDDDDSEAQLKADPRVRALIAKKRKEREEKERLEAEKKAARLALREQLSSEIGAANDSDQDESGRKLTQHRPAARKASKKAMEEMNRETQRISRNMQLAHQAQTKKKITKESFFARFNFMQPEETTVAGPTAENSSTTAGSQNSSDNEAHKGKETPQTSPVLDSSDKRGPVELINDSRTENETEMQVEDLPSLEDLVARPQELIQKINIEPVEGKENPKKHLEATKSGQNIVSQPPVRVHLSRQFVAQHQKEDSDDELEVVTDPAKCRRIAAFENLPAKRLQESASLLKLKALAHITSPTRRSKTMNSAELSATLLFQARQQAAKERQERMEELRAKGIVIETAAERAAMEDELENLVEKARQEAEDIARRERKSKREDGGNEMDDDDDDDDFEISGSDGEGEEAEDEDEDEEEEEGGQGLIDSEAGEDEESGDGQLEAKSLNDMEMSTARRKRVTRVISDDEDDDEAQEPRTPIKPIHSTVASVERPQFPGLTSDGLTMGLTQAFAGTLGASQPITQLASPAIPNSLPDPAQIPEPQTIIKDSQGQRAESTDILMAYAYSEVRVSESPAPRAMSQFSQIPDPSQDAGFVLSPFDPSKRFMETPHSTIETVVADDNENEFKSPVPQRRAKHLRRGRLAELSMVEEEHEGEFEIDASAFDVMKKAAKKTKVPFDWKTSKAKEIVEEAAEESDDEYAGLGGASDDSDDEENIYDQQMINDNSGETVDEKQLAALNALHHRNADEKQVAKLLKDITTGALRRRKNGDDEFDLDDSDDELLARRRQKQREFARMRKALLADEKIGEIAENPKKAAFFRAIEDRDSDDDSGFDFLDEEENAGSQEETSSQGLESEPPQQQQQPTSEENSKRKRPLEPSADDINNRPPPHLRRKPASAMSKKPATLTEIRETLSFLTERPEYDSFHEDASMEDVDGAQGDTDEDNTPRPEPAEAFAVPSHPRRTRGVVVDRLALLRQASSNSATAASSSTRMAFSTSGGNDLSFRPPPLLRRSTTSSSSSSTTSKSDSSKRVAKATAAGPKAKTGAVNYYTAAREKEREREIRARHRSSGSNIKALIDKHATNRLGSLGGTGRWE